MCVHGRNATPKHKDRLNFYPCTAQCCVANKVIFLTRTLSTVPTTYVPYSVKLLRISLFCIYLLVKVLYKGSVDSRQCEGEIHESFLPQKVPTIQYRGVHNEERGRQDLIKSVVMSHSTFLLCYFLSILLLSGPDIEKFTSLPLK